MASVLKEEPDLTRVPARVRPLLRACLKKNPRERLRDIGDAKLLFDLEDLSPEQQRSTPVLVSDRQAYFVPGDGSLDGHLIFQRDLTVLAQPFDLDTFTLEGEPAPLAAGVGSFAAAFSGLFSASPMGTLVYRTGGSTRPSLRWFEPQTKTSGSASGPGAFANLALSPNGSQIAIRMDDEKGNRDIWVVDLQRSTRTRLTFDPSLDDNPIWTPDGKRIVFAASRNNSRMDLYERSADGSGDERLIWRSDRDKVPTSLSPDGRYLLFQEADPKTAQDLWVLPLESGAKPAEFQRSEAVDVVGVFSPDGRWVAYMSTETGTPEIYVRPFDPARPASTGGKWMVSQQGGLQPRWRRDGRQVFYLRPSSQLMAVDIEATTSIRMGNPIALSDMGQYLLAPFGVTNDGKRFYFVSIDQSGPQSPFTVLLDWKDVLRADSRR